MIRLSSLLFASLLVLTASAAAQQGPAPGYDDPLVYAEDYAASQADAAAADPEGYAASRASPEALASESAHAAYMACWTADVYGGATPPGCDQFYTSPQEGAPLPEEEDDATDDAQDAGAEIEDASQEYAAEAAEIAGDIVADPTSAPSQLERLRDATFVFVDRVVRAVGSVGTGAIETAMAIVGGLGLGVGAIGFGLGAGVDGAMAGTTAAATGASEAGQVLVGSLASAVGSTAERFGVGWSVGVDAWQDVGSTAASAVQGSVEALTTGVADLVASIQESLAALFQSSGAPDAEGATDSVHDLVDADGLLHGVTQLVD